MQLTELAFKLIIIFIPGILSTFIINCLIERKNFSNRTFFISSLLLGYLSYGLLYISKCFYKLLLLGFNEFNFKKIEIHSLTNMMKENYSINYLEVF